MSGARPEEGKETILVVDDDEMIRSLLREYVLDLGYTPAEEGDGPAALEHIRSDPPDLILLDIELPGLDGREVLSRLKSDARLREIPVIVLSGIEETAVAVQCIEKGAEDYLAKPFEPALLQARIGSCLERRRLRLKEQAYQRWIEQYNRELEQRVREKTRALAEANERLRILDQAKSDFLGLIAHELRTPVTGVYGAMQILFAAQPDASGRKESEAILRGSVERLLRIVEDALLLTQIQVSAESFSLEPSPLRSLVAAAAAKTAAFAASRGVTLGPAPDDAGLVLCQPELLTKALASLLECAVKFSGRGQVVELAHARVDGAAQLRIQATGHGIPEKAVAKFFEVFSVADPITPGGDLGLGPPLAAQVLRLLGGSVTAESPDPRRVCFTVTLRAARETP